MQSFHDPQMYEFTTNTNSRLIQTIRDRGDEFARYTPGLDMYSDEEIATQSMNAAYTKKQSLMDKAGIREGRWISRDGQAAAIKGREGLNRE